VSLPIVSVQLLEQQLSAPHGFPQLPQLFGSIDVSMHVLLQHDVPPRHWPLHGCVPVSCPPPLSFGVPVSGFVPLSVFVLESDFGPESNGTVSSAAVPVAHPAKITAKRHNPPAGPTTRMDALAERRF